MPKATLVNGGERYVMKGRLFLRGVTVDVDEADAAVLAMDTVLDRRGNLVRRFRVSGGPPELVAPAPPVLQPPDLNPDLIVKTAEELERETVGREPDANRGDLSAADL